MNLNVYRVNQLDSFFNDFDYKHQEHIALSPHRASSYKKNPRSNENMPVLFTLSKDGKILAYRTLLPDYFINEGNKIPFAWLSGSFVAPEYRRKGLSTKLLNEVENAWDGNLMYTNYAPESKAVYDKTEKFHLFQINSGKKYYLKSSLSHLLKNRVHFPKPFNIIDKIVNTLHNPSIQELSKMLPEGISVSATDKLDVDIIDLLQKETSNSLFSRSIEEFNWIKNNPWITFNVDEGLKGTYQFTWLVKNFQNTWFKIQKRNALGFLWITIVNEKLSIPYYFSNDRMIDIAARQVIFHEMIKNNAAHVSTIDTKLGPLLGMRKNPFLFSRKMPRNYFAHRNLLKQIPTDKKIYDGDGDYVFT